FAQPFREDGILRIEHRLVEKGDGGESGVTRIFRGIAGCESLARGRLQSLADVVTESIGVGNTLAVGPQTDNGGKHILKQEGQVIWPAGIGRRRHSKLGQLSSTTNTCNSGLGNSLGT